MESLDTLTFTTTSTKSNDCSTLLHDELCTILNPSESTTHSGSFKVERASYQPETSNLENRNDHSRMEPASAGAAQQAYLSPSFIRLIHRAFDAYTKVRPSDAAGVQQCVRKFNAAIKQADKDEATYAAQFKEAVYSADPEVKQNFGVFLFAQSTIQKLLASQPNGDQKQLENKLALQFIDPHIDGHTVHNLAVLLRPNPKLLDSLLKFRIARRKLEDNGGDGILDAYTRYNGAVQEQVISRNMFAAVFKTEATAEQAEAAKKSIQSDQWFDANVWATLGQDKP